jgi:TRAP-type C4-dicarboxylate transport system substrate-binding protein
MAKYEQVFEDTQALFNQKILDAGLDRFMMVTVLATNQSKKIYDVQKANEITRFRTGDDVYIFVNDLIFEQLTPEQQSIVAESAVAHISFDTEKDKIVITKPNFKAHKPIIKKYTYDVLEVLEESIESLYQKRKEEEDASKAQTEKLSGKK